MVAERREKRVQQVSVRGMDLDQPGAGKFRAARGCGKSLDGRRDLGRGESARRLISVGKSDSAGREDGSPSALLERKRRSPIPGLTRTGFSARMRQLKSRHRSLLSDESKSPAQ